MTIKKYLFTDFEDRDELYVGETKDIKAMYKSMCRHAGIMDICPAPAKFSIYKNVYGILLEESGFCSVVSSDTIMSFILKGIIEEV